MVLIGTSYKDFIYTIRATIYIYVAPSNHMKKATDGRLLCKITKVLSRHQSSGNKFLVVLLFFLHIDILI